MIVALWFSLFACPKHGEPVVTVDTWLTAADAAWDRRGADGFGPVSDALDSAWGVAPEDARVRWRLARLSVAKGLTAADPDAALSQFATARAQGLACLDLQADFDQPKVDPFTRLGPDDAPCAAWTAYAWARWWTSFGPDAAALDHDRIALLASEAEHLGGDPGLVAWTRALVHAGEGDRGAVRDFHAAIAADPSDLWRRADLVLLVARPGGDEQETDVQIAAMDKQGPRSPEDRAALTAVHGP